MLNKLKSNPYYIGAGSSFLFTMFYFFLSLSFEGEFAGVPNLIPFFVLFVYFICYIAEKILYRFRNKSLVFHLSLLLLLATGISVFFSLLFYRDLYFFILICPLLAIGSLFYYFSGRLVKRKSIALFLSTSPLYVFLLSLVFVFLSL